jgi:hypothetical protein
VTHGVPAPSRTASVSASLVAQSSRTAGP